MNKEIIKVQKFDLKTIETDLNTELSKINSNDKAIAKLVKDAEAILEKEITDIGVLNEYKAIAKQIQKIRTPASDFFKNQRDPYNQVAQYIIDKEKEFLNKISIEGKLKAKCDEYDKKIKAEKQAEIDAQNKRSLERNNALILLGALHIDDEYVLGNCVWDVKEVQSADDEAWEFVLSKFKEQYEKQNEERIAKENKDKFARENMDMLIVYSEYLKVELAEINYETVSKERVEQLISLAKTRIEEKRKTDEEKATKQQILTNKIAEFRIKELKTISEDISVGIHCISYLDKQYDLRLINYNIVDDTEFEAFCNEIKIAQSDEKIRIEEEIEKQKKVNNILTELDKIGFTRIDDKLIYKDYVSKISFSSILGLDESNLEQIFSNLASEKIEYEKSVQASISDEEKYNKYIANLIKIETPNLVSNVYAKKLNAILDFIKKL